MRGKIQIENQIWQGKVYIIQAIVRTGKTTAPDIGNVCFVLHRLIEALLGTLEMYFLFYTG